MGMGRRQCILVLMTVVTMLTIFHGAAGAVTFTLDQIKKAGIDDLDTVQPPMTGPPDNLAPSMARFHLSVTCRFLS